MTEPIGVMFPTGGPVPPELVIGRESAIADLQMMIGQSVHVLIRGPRRIGKTTVCRAVCAGLARDMAVISIEVPERPDSRDLLQDIVNHCAALSLRDEAGKVLRALRPLFGALLDKEGVPLDLSELGERPAEQTMRAVLELPIRIAAESGRRVLLFFDEIQRIVDYSDGEQVLGDLVDIYGSHTDVIVMADGSDERTVDGLFGSPVNIGKLLTPYPLAPTIDVSTWRQPIALRFDDVGHSAGATGLDELLAFGAGRPYETVLACKHAALAAHTLGDGTPVGSFEAGQGIDAARSQLEADGA